MLRPDEQVFAAMLDGWRDQQLARGLSRGTLEPRLAMVRRFQAYTNDWPWAWRPVDVEEFLSELRSGPRPAASSTIRAYGGTLRLFCDYVADPRYEWTSTCEQLFGSHPAQVCFEWNTAVHSSDYEGRPQRRSLTRPELQRLFDHVDDEVEALRRRANKGWLTALRDSAALKVAYGFGLRRRELTMLDLEDFGPNPHAPEFGSYGVVYVRWGKATKGGPPRRRSVLTVFPWTVDVVAEWVGTYRRLLPTAARSSALWPSERAARVELSTLGARFARYRDDVELPPEIGLHCLRHSYVTHLIEAGYDPLFVQQQVGHSYASTTALYTSVSSDFRTRTLRRALDQDVSRALSATAPGNLDATVTEGSSA
ncbi:tyrosine-type recombinase/integrase [Cellulomonas endophytica]|uniref:tyrosine-type recombinase/integrase n=1 Tax=Cellulomonas endophytica TaxID=2494735 RepID=UPI001F0C8EF6|nr:site-specific integrase [Cellulomonas endophytica]